MRADFAKHLHTEMSLNNKILLLTGDLGYGLWDRIKIDYPDRFINTLSSEQLMLGIASGLAIDGYIPVVYSITPFVIFRPYELIRNYMDHENIAIKLVGGGRNRDYGYLGFSHWAEDDIAALSIFKNIKTYKPEKINSDICKEFLYNNLPCYLNLKK